MIFQAARDEVYNRGSAPQEFLDEMVEWAKKAPTAFFALNDRLDIYDKVKPELGPYGDSVHRTAVMLEVLRVLALFESGCNWTEGVDISKKGASTNENEEAGAWQCSYDCRKISSDLQTILLNACITNGIQFQQALKENHDLAMTVITIILHHSTKANGPLYKGEERKQTWPDRPKLWADKESIYPYLSRAAVAEFQQALTE